MLFENLPQFPPALPDEELKLLASLPRYDTVAEIGQEEERICRSLERKGLVKIHLWKTDPAAHWPTMFAGRTDQLQEVKP